MTGLWTARLRFALFIAFPAVLTIVVVLSVVLSIMDGMARGANRLSEQNGRMAAKAALASVLGEIEKFAHDHAAWDDAVENSYGEIDRAWLAQTWGDAFNRGAYDAVFLTDLQGKTLVGLVKGKEFNVAASDYLGFDLKELIAALPSDGKNVDTASGFFATGGVLMVAAVAPVVPASPGMTIPQSKPNYATYVRTLDAELLAELAKSFVLDGLTFTSASDASPYAIDIADPAGRIISRLRWSGARPGDVALEQVWGTAAFAMTILTAVMAAFVFLFWRNLKQSRDNEMQAEWVALHDELSGLANRRGIAKALNQALTGPLPPGYGIALIYADLDRFKEVNDTFGHEIGDRLIRAAGAGFAQLAAGKGTLARLGGDEFAVLVLCPDAAQTACDIAEYMIDMLRTPFDFEGRVISVGTSIGLVVPAAGETSAEEILRRADVAMYRAKAAGRNRLCVYEPIMDFERKQRQLMATDIKAAMDAGELELYYQPYIDAATRAITGVEALIRWSRKGFEDVSPAVFIPVAEECGLIDELGRFVMNTACQQARLWPGIKMSINVSPAQFRNPSFVSTVERCVAAAAINPEQIEIEVTESYLIDDPERAHEVITGLHRLGVTVSIDDFGTGYSSIGYLRRFTFNKLKIDRSLTNGLVTNYSAQRIVQATVLIAESLSLRVTAEGVEDEGDATILRAAGCHEFQGFLFHRPMRAEALTGLLKQQGGTFTSARTARAA
jgi:diguanylate cyclase (GGDEF)-like protein